MPLLFWRRCPCLWHGPIILGIRLPPAGGRGPSYSSAASPGSQPPPSVCHARRCCCILTCRGRGPCCFISLFKPTLLGNGGHGGLLCQASLLARCCQVCSAHCCRRCIAFLPLATLVLPSLASGLGTAGPGAATPFSLLGSVGFGIDVFAPLTDTAFLHNPLPYCSPRLPLLMCLQMLLIAVTKDSCCKFHHYASHSGSGGWRCGFGFGEHW